MNTFDAVQAACVAIQRLAKMADVEPMQPICLTETQYYDLLSDRRIVPYTTVRDSFMGVKIKVVR